MDKLNLNQHYNPIICWIEENNINTVHKLRQYGFGIKNNSNANIKYIPSPTLSRLDIQNQIEEKLNYYIYLFDNINSSMNYLLKLKFVETIIFVKGDLYNKFIKEFKKKLKEIRIIPKIIIYSPANKDSSILINSQNKNFYSYNVITSISELKVILDSLEKKKVVNLKQSQFITDVDKKLLILDEIKDEKDIVLPAIYKILIFGEEEPGKEESSCCCCCSKGTHMKKMGDGNCIFGQIDNTQFIKK